MLQNFKVTNVHTCSFFKFSELKPSFTSCTENQTGGDFRNASSYSGSGWFKLSKCTSDFIIQ